MATATGQALEQFVKKGQKAQAAVDAALATERLQMMPIGVELLRESALNTRKHFDKKKLEELTESVRSKGVLTPLLVRCTDDRPGPSGYEILAGARRLRAAKAAGLAFVPCVIREVDDTTALELITIENLQREDVHPLEEAEGYKRLLAVGKYDVPALAGKVGKSESYVYQRLKLAELIEPAKKAFLEEKITAGHAILIARLQPKDQKEALAACREEYNDSLISVRALGQWIQAEILLDLHSASFPKDDASLLPKAGACINCPKRTGFAQALFPDVKKKDTCTDPACFHEKVGAFTKRAQAEAHAAGKDLVQLSGEWSASKGLIRRGLWENFERKPATCTSAERAIVTEGSGQGKLATICRDPKCHTHSRERNGPAFNERHQVTTKAARAIEKRRQMEMERRGRIFRAIAERLPIHGGHPEELDLLRWCAEHLDHDHAKKLCEAMGWPARKGYGSPDYEAAIQAQLRKVSSGDTWGWQLLVMAASEDLFWGAYLNSIPKPVLLDRLAKMARVDTAKITQALAAERESKRPAQRKVSAKVKGGSAKVKRGKAA